MTAGNGELRQVDGREQTHGLVVYRASRLEALLVPLTELLRVTAPDDALAPQTIVAAHPGMQQWLKLELARAAGVAGIAANLDILLPSAWIDRLARDRLGQQAVALPRYQRRHLRWTIHAALDQAAELGIDDARIVAYLGTDVAAIDRARRRFQLADRLAHIYSQYLVYRPDWLRAWEGGNFCAAARSDNGALAMTERQLLAPLWRQVRAKLGAHRGDIVGDLIKRLEQDAAASLGHALHVFGVSHLAPAELTVLRQYARQHLVALYVPDPCREYWGGLAGTLPQLRVQHDDEQIRIAQAQGNDYWADQGHPLLARWGRMGQHFIMALADGDGDVLADVRHHEDASRDAPPDRLARVQMSIRALDPALLKVDLVPNGKRELRDGSLRIHACHTRLRELEVLRDSVLDALEVGGGALKPGDIVVMAPDIQAYVPLIPAVFGIPGDAQAQIPYHLADVAMARSHSLFGAFARLLELPGTRITATQVVDLLGVPQVARRLGLDAGALDNLVSWLHESRVAWALDGAFREHFGVPGIAAHTFGWALDRLVAGYVMADAATCEPGPGVTLADGCELAPLAGIHGPSAEALGALDQLLREIQSLCDLAATERRASTWAQVLENCFEAVFRIDLHDPDARQAQTLIAGYIRAIASEPQAAGEDPVLHFGVVRDLLAERVAAAPERQRFLLGGVTFCSMVPQRAIPFKLIAVLGLNDGEFPRAGGDDGLDLMSRYRRIGDRDVRSDDRYLFLETVMSARKRLHLSYIGADVRDGKLRNPAAPLADLMAVLDDAADLRADDTQTDRPWLVRHRLQPFDAAYFDAIDPRLFSFDAAFAQMHGRGERPALAPFRDAAVTTATENVQAIDVREVRAYFKDPARQMLAQRLHIRLDALDENRLPEDEPLEERFDAIDTVPSKLFFRDALPAWPHVDWPPALAPAWLRLTGMLPPGKPGQIAWKHASTTVAAMLEIVRALPGFEQGAPLAQSLLIDQVISDRRIAGRVEDAFVVSADGRAQWWLLRAFPGKKGELKKEHDLSFKDRIPLFLDWALLRLHSALQNDPLPAIRMAALVKVGAKHASWQTGINAWDDVFINADPTRRHALIEDLQARVTRLLDFWQHAQSDPRWYFPKTSWQAVAGNGNSVSEVWVGNHATGERDYAPGYNRLLAGDVDFAEGSVELSELQSCARQLLDCISLTASEAAP